jgi:hypothetical protein
MARWEDVEREAPALADRVRASFDANTHKTMATLRKDGSPRISGTELDFVDGDVWFGSMWEALKARDLQRDGRLALHNAVADTEMKLGDAKIAGRAIEITDDGEKVAFMQKRADAGSEHPPGPFHLFRIDVGEVVHTRIGDPPDHLVIESWHEGLGLKRTERK